MSKAHFYLGTVLASSVSVSGCAEGDHFLKSLSKAKSAIFGESDETEVPGDDLQAHLSQNFKSKPTDVSSMLSLVDIQVNDNINTNLVQQGAQEPPQASQEAIDLLAESTFLKLGFKSDDYQLNENDFFEPTPTGDPGETTLSLQDTETINWTAESDEFIVSPIAKMPVRNQGRRGTCASFAGIAQLEALLIKKYQLDEIDLSEQRFYYMSKPESWLDGGSLSKQGSNSGTGFAKSFGYQIDDHTYPPDSPEDFNIPLETDCVYNSSLGDNDLQSPQSANCFPGVAKVTDFRAWAYKFNERPQNAQQIFDFLVERDYPVIVASGLSSNWERTDGVITLADSGFAGETSHAAGHAYLIVGARKLDETLYPNEGGMCFVIRNSWGKSWGIDGHACMTLAWFNAFKYDTGFPQVLDAVIDEEKFEEAQLNVSYDRNVLSKPLDNNERSDDSVRKRGRAVFQLQAEDNADIGEPVNYITKSGESLQFFYKTLDNTIELNGLLASNKDLTKSLFLETEDSKIFYSEQDYPRYQVGILDTTKKLLILCSAQFSEVCSLNYDSPSNDLIIGLTPRQKSLKLTAPPYSWTGFDLSGYGLEFSKPKGLSTQIDTRLKVKGEYTNPLRFLIDPGSSNIEYKGNTIGNLGAASLCSGEFADRCKIVLSGQELHLFERTKRDE